MFATFAQKIKLIVTDSNLRARLLFVLGALALFRMLAIIPIPGIDREQLTTFLARISFLGC